MKSRHSLLVAALSLAATASATITLNITGGVLYSPGGAPLADGRHLQLVVDRSGKEFDRPVAGYFQGTSDDFVLHSFALDSSTSSNGAGSFSLNLAGLSATTPEGISLDGKRFALRWFDTPHAGADATEGLAYGENVESLWVLPDDGETGIYAFTTTSAGGTLPDSAGMASSTVGAPALTSDILRGYGSLYAMSRDTALRQEDRIRERLEQRRHDKSTEDWESFVTASAATATNDKGSDKPVFDYDTFGGLVGLDKKLSADLVVGGAAGYDNGTASFHNDEGEATMNRVRATAFLSTGITGKTHLEAGLSGGFSDFSTERRTTAGTTEGSTTGYDLGANLAVVTTVELAENLALTPFVGASYAHHQFQGFTETGTGIPMKVEGWSQDSLRASIGSGFAWWLPAGDLKWRFGVDAAYNRELLDTESDIVGGLASGGATTTTRAAALPSDTVSVSPSVALHLDEETSVGAGLVFDYGFDGRTYAGVNFTLRHRF